MAYITYADYAAIYGANTAVTEEEFPVYAAAASDIIDAITGGKASDDDLPAWIVTAIKKATAAEVLYFGECGGVDAVVSGQTGEGFTVGKVSVQGAAKTSAFASARDIVSPLVYVALGHTGLLYRGATCYDLSRAIF